jgi:hypothetical protein
MPDYIGLYYPHLTFPSDAWIKLAAIYWDRLGRIVPSGFEPQDSDTVQRLKGELGFVENFEPAMDDTLEVGELFFHMLLRYQEQLRRHYSVLSQDSELEYIYSDRKMAPMLSHALLAAGLAVQRTEVEDRRGWRAQVGMHPRLAFVYMEALAEQMALSRGLRPVTDNVRDHVAMGEYTLERLAQALLEADDRQPHLVGAAPTADEIERHMASIALQSVLPKNIARVPIEKIIKLRKKHHTELTAFQTHIHEFVAKLDTIQQINDPQALKAHLEVAYERELKPQLDDLKRCMKSLAIETVIGVFNVKTALPPLLASAGTSLHLLSSLPLEVTIPVAVAWSIFPVYQKKREKIYEKVHASPVAYLLYAQETLTPTMVVSQERQTTRHMLFGV